MSGQMRCAEIIAAHAGREGALLPILQDIQSQFGCVDASAEAEVAQALNLSRAEVHGVVSFYHDFSVTPDSRLVIELCRSEACQARGSEALIPAIADAAGERIRLRTVYCLGLCSIGPAARAGDSLYARLDAERAVALVQSL